MNYREQTATGTEWRRCHQVHLYNPYEGLKTCRFDEETVVTIAGRTVSAGDGFITAEFDPSGSFPMLDPATGEPTGETMSHLAIYQALFSLYMHTALARDAGGAT